MNRRVIQFVAGLACAALLLALTFSRVDLTAVKAGFINAKPSWIAAAVIVYAGNLLLRAWRWSVILRQVQRIPYTAVLVALLVGYGVNSVIPARLGELFRAEFFKQRYGLSRVWALTSIMLERLLDGLVTVACLGMGLLFAGNSGQHGRTLIGVTAIAAALFGITLFLTMVFSGPRIYAVFDRWPKLSDQMDMVRRSLEVVRSRRFLLVAAGSLLVYVPDTLSLWLIVKSVGVTLSFPYALVLVGAAGLSTLLPSGPGFLGPLQLAYVLTMELTGDPAALGIAAATLAQLYLLLPVVVIAGVILALGPGADFKRLMNAPRNG